MKRTNAVLMALLLAGGGYSAGVSADTDEMQVPSGFRYATDRWVSANIKLAAPDRRSILLSFYSEGTNGLRLLENGFTDTTGRYTGQLHLPAHLTQVKMVVRGAMRQSTLVLPISADSVNYVE